MKKIIIIPAYNEEQNIERLIDNIKESCEGYDFIIINDCSRDRTLEICRSRGFPVIDLPINLGIGGCMQTGYRYARLNHYDIAVQIDGDGQHDPREIRKLEQYLLEEKKDLVIGSRFILKEGYQSSCVRRWGIRIFSLQIRLLTGMKITDPTSGFRLCNSNIINTFADRYPKDYPEPESLVALIKRGFLIGETDVIMNERNAGKSSISVIKSVYYMIKVSLAIFIGCLSIIDKR